MAKILVPSSELCTVGAAGAATNLDNSFLSLSLGFSPLSLPHGFLFSLLSPKFPKTTMAKPGSSPAPLITTADGGGFRLGLASLSSRGYW